MKKRNLRRVGAILLATTMLAGCGTKGQDATSANSGTNTAPDATNSGGSTDGGAVTGGDTQMYRTNVWISRGKRGVGGMGRLGSTYIQYTHIYV